MSVVPDDSSLGASSELVSYRTARYPRTHISMNHLNGVASIFPPMIITISSVSLMSGSQPRLPPGELSNINPKSEEREMRWLKQQGEVHICQVWGSVMFYQCG